MKGGLAIHRPPFYTNCRGEFTPRIVKEQPPARLCLRRVVRGAAGMRFTHLFGFATMPEL